MSYQLNKKLLRLEPYQPIGGDYIIRLDANESFINLNETLHKEIADEIARVSLNRYPDAYAKEVTDAFSRLYNIPSKYLTAGNGSDELISIITSCFLEKDDAIMTFTPDFSMYEFYGTMFELRVETMAKDFELKINVDQAINFCEDNNIKAVIFSNPCNPTSLGLTGDEVRKFIKGIPHILVILDEAYMDFWDQSLLNEIDILENDNLIILKTCSKAIGLAAIRLGFAAANEKITSALRAAKSPYNTDSISQAIGKCILSHKEMLDENNALIRKSVQNLYADIKIVSAKYNCIENIYETVTNFIFIKTKLAQQIYIMLLKRSISIRKMGTYLRITTGSKEENLEFLKNFEEVLFDLEGIGNENI